MCPVSRKQLNCLSGDVGPSSSPIRGAKWLFVRAICEWRSDRMSAVIRQNPRILIAAHRNRISEPPCQESLRRLIQTQSLKLADRLFAHLHFDLYQVFEGTIVERLIGTCPTARELSKDDRKRLAIEASPKSGVEHTNPL